MLNAQQIADSTGGKILGSETEVITGIAKIEEAKSGDLAFVGNPKYEKYIYETEASIVLVGIGFEPKGEVKPTLIKTLHPYLSFCQILDAHFNPNIHPTGIDQFTKVGDDVELYHDIYLGSFSVIEKGAKIGHGVKIYPNCYIGRNCVVEDGTILYSGVKIMPECKVGKNNIIHSNTVIGSDGFGHAPMPDGSYAKIPQVGNVIIEDDVEIGANCSIDRATMGSTIIRKGVKLDNLIQVAHNVEIGANTVIAAQTGISGSTKLGERCMIGGQVGFVGHIHVANGTQIGAQSGVPKAIKKENQQFIGTPLMPIKQAFKTQVLMRNLPQLNERLNELENKLNNER